MERFYRRHLPHWRIDSPGIVYFATWHLAVGQPVLRPDERDAVASAVRFWEGRRCASIAWVVMDDHVHVVLRLLNDGRLEVLLHSWKSFTANELAETGQRTAPVWQNESFDRIVRNETELRDTVLYVCSNPRKRWPDLEDYRWVWPELRDLV
jgi:REP element-mobilizing transposase RayT